MASGMKKLRDISEELIAAEIQKQKKDAAPIERLLTGVSLEPKMAKEENWVQTKCVELLNDAKALAKELVCSLSMKNQYMAADEVWAIIPELHASRAKGAKMSSEGERVKCLNDIVAVIRRLAAGEEPYPLSEEEQGVLDLLDTIGSDDIPRDGEFELTPEQTEAVEKVQSLYTNDEVDALREKKNDNIEREERYPEAEPLSEESIEKLTLMADYIEQAATKLLKVTEIREAIVEAAYEQHYFDVEDVLEEVGIACLTMLAQSTAGKTEPWYEGREAAKEVLGACQRTALKNMRLKNRISERPTASDDSAPAPPPWYLATQGEYFTGGWRATNLLTEPIPKYKWDDSSPTGYA